MFGSYLVQFVSIVGLDRIVLWLISADDRLPFPLVLGSHVGSDPATTLVLEHRLHGGDLVRAPAIQEGQVSIILALFVLGPFILLFA